MSRARVTVVVVARERFALALRSLASLRAATRLPFELVVIDGGSPGPVRRALAAEARAGGFHLVRTDFYLAPNEARNLGLRHAETEYVCFCDNDVLFSPGWLEALVACADDTGATLVGPVYVEGEAQDGPIHMAGGVGRIEERDGRRLYHEKHAHVGVRLADARLVRAETELVEYHTMLARTDALRRAGGLDEGFLSCCDHNDVCLAVLAAGGKIVLEPRAAVRFLRPRSVALRELPYFLLRWSDAWTRASLDHFRRKWRLAPGDPWSDDHHEVISAMRLNSWRTWSRLAERLQPEARHFIARRLLVPLDTRLNRALIATTRHTWRDRRTDQDILKTGEGTQGK